MARSETQSFILASMNIIANKTDQLCLQNLEDVTFKQWFLLLMISRMPSKVKTVQDVADFACLTRQNTKRMLDALAQKGMCTLSSSTIDKRALQVNLTRKGLACIQSNQHCVNESLEPLFEKLDDEDLKTLAHLLQVLLTQVNELL